MPKLVDVSAYPIWDVINVLLEDKTTGKNVVWATDAYAARGPGYGPEDPITKNAFIGDDPVLIQPRIKKDAQEQQARTKKKAEVYTPSWLCNKMNNYCDAEWFGRPDVFNNENGGGAWTAQDDSIQFNEKKGRKTKEWQKYVDSRRLEITCGEAPFLVSRYDAATGEILPIKQRIGILDRKLRVVDENTTTETDWLKWAQRAVESCYGYEYQGDSLLIARNNVLMTFYDYYTERWKKLPEKRLFKKIANIVAWNIWQMDGLTDAPPFGKTVSKKHDYPLFQQLKENVPIETAERVFEKPSKINNWRSKKSFTFIDLKGILIMKNKNKLFDFVIGNPPYQEDVQNQGDRANPVYNKFMDASYEIANCVELIHPARFLFEAGQTPKAWIKKMLADKHLKVLQYWPNSASVFQNVELKGGVAITVRDIRKSLGPIGTFTSFEQLNGIVKKVTIVENNNPRMDSLIASQGLYRFSEVFFQDYPHAMDFIGKGTGNKIVSSIMEKMPEVFLERRGKDDEYIKFLGRINGQRKYKWIKRKYLIENNFIDKYNLFIPEANNSGIYGETLTEPEVGDKQEGSSDTFLNAGPFDTISEAQNLATYIKTKFFRSLLGIKKVTQHCPQSVWTIVPIQNFSNTSDIDWSKSVTEIDQQLYKKYGLSEKEIEFIETHVKEMQ